MVNIHFRILYVLSVFTASSTVRQYTTQRATTSSSVEDGGGVLSGMIWSSVQFYSKGQDAQLSKRDRAAGCVNLAKSGRLELGDNILLTL